MAKEHEVSLGSNENILTLILMIDVQDNSVDTLKPNKLYTLGEFYGM